MEVEGSTTFSMGGNCCYVGRERPWRVLESSTRIQSFKSISVVWVDEMVGAGGYKFIEILRVFFRRPPFWRIFGPDLVVCTQDTGMCEIDVFTSVFPIIVYV